MASMSGSFPTVSSYMMMMVFGEYSPSGSVVTSDGPFTG